MDLHSIRKIVSYKKGYDSIFSSPHNEFGSYDNLPEDDRYLISGVDDIDGGDTFVDYMQYFFETYEDDLFC